ncbi:MAG: 16S rRNA (uracil(1498)-N(3))-methyltransferase [Betaproteobacteria bacterium RBG_16_66_20]|nr:MAG: 16S rRNA (uracil(1498)-N(3))-methyltransferase [Betaproteobacteria bacterium RBG_16_66_20]
MPRIFVETELHPRSRLTLPDDAAHHAARVLRLREGDAMVLFDGRGGEYEARLSLPGRGRVVAETGVRHDIERESPLAVTLLQAVSSSEKMDFTIQKAVELGVAAIQPVLGAKSVVRLSAEREEKKLARWRRVAIAACEQCGRNRLPPVREAMSIEAYCRAPGEASLRLLLSPKGKIGLRDVTQQIEPVVTIAAGPEAGFSAAEEQLLERAGFVAVRLGQRILRTETAALAALAALNAIAGDF